MRLLGVDFGKSKIGLAYSEGILASPLSVIPVKSQKKAAVEITAICARLSIEKIVLGLSGGILDKEVVAFGETLRRSANVSVDFVDEAFTSRDAVTKMVEGNTTKKKRREFEDAVAATLILNTYIENQNST